LRLRPDTLAFTCLLALLTALGPFSVDMYLASLPDIGRSLSASPAAVQLTLSVYLVGYAVGQLVYGPLSDRFGRRPVLLISLAGYCAASLACALAPTIELLLLARACQALGSSGAIVIARAVVRDLYEGARAGRELALMGAIFSLAPVIAPSVGGLLQSGFGWRSNFVVLVLIGATAGLLVWLMLPETLRARSAEPPGVRAMLASYREILSHRAFRAYLGLISISFGGVFAWISASPFVLQDLYGLTPFWFGFAFAAASAGFLTGSILSTRLGMRLGIDRSIGVGAACVAAGGLGSVAAVAFSASVIPLLAAISLYACGMGLVQPQTIAGALMPFPHKAGAASSLVGVAQMSAAAVVGVGVGHALGTSAWPLALPCAFFGVLTLVIWMMTRRVRASAARH
jgi:DHA1 family bicyclomycin/chloramphenicol resistance-like MFS transporter